MATTASPGGGDPALPAVDSDRMPAETDFPPVLPSQIQREKEEEDEPKEVEYEEEEVDLDKLPFWERPYYWQFVGVDLDSMPRWQKAWHLSRWVGSKVFFGMEFVGEIIAEIVGMNQSRYQWVIDTVAEDERRDRRKQEILKRRDEMVQDGLLEVAAKEGDEAEGGLVDVSDDEEGGDGA